MRALGAVLAGALAGLAMAGPAPAASLALPCPLPAGWQVVRELALPRTTASGEPIGGFSAAHYSAADDSLLLLSDLPRGAVLRWSGLARGAAPELVQITPLRAGPARSLPAAIDAEGLVVRGRHWWVASEGRRSRDRPAQLLQFSSASGQLLRALELPGPWQPGDGQGLASNGGPESLLWLPPGAPSRAPALLMAAELPLLQDPPQQLRLLRWQWPTAADPAATEPEPVPQGALQLPPGEGWGLTDLLLPRPGQLLALLRRFEPPDRWRIRLALYPLPTGASPAPVAAHASWDLLAAGLTPDNWEALSLGPPLPDGRPSLLLVSDDNLQPHQANRLALLAPQRSRRCPSPP